ncbi:hypothetical protein VNO77_03331 [Canavalia gladiata]|uniref:Uncharacterized protein n=1 Tax=Canavalia gladiata TaxID=3824 RepID=A0AAN9R6S5_CANGL
MVTPKTIEMTKVIVAGRDMKVKKPESSTVTTSPLSYHSEGPAIALPKCFWPLIEGASIACLFQLFSNVAKL